MDSYLHCFYLGLFLIICSFHQMNDNLLIEPLKCNMAAFAWPRIDGFPTTNSLFFIKILYTINPISDEGQRRAAP